jgi:MFS family permease
VTTADAADPTATPAPAPRPSAFAVFRKRDFTLLWLAQFVSTAGSALTDLAAGILVYQLTGSALAVGLTLMATAIPSLIVGLIAGVFVDRYDRKRIMLWSNILQAVLVGLIPFVISINVLGIYVVILLNAAVKQFFDPANESLVPDIASDEELAAANSLLQIASFGSNAIGFAGAGLLASLFDINFAFFIDALTFVVSAICIWFVRVPRNAPLEEETTVGVVVENLKEGVGTLLGTPILRTLFILALPYIFSVGLWNVLLLPFAFRILGASEFAYGVQEALTSVGFVVGSLLMARFSYKLSEGSWIVVSGVGMGIAGIAYALTTSIPLAITIAIISGIANAPIGVARATLMQRNTPRELRGRVFSSFFVMRDVVFLLGMGAAGLADIIDIRLLVILSALLLILMAALAAFAPGVGRPAPDWLRLRRRLETAVPAPATALAGVRPATIADFDRLTTRLATFGRLSEPMRLAFVREAVVREVPEGTRIVTHGDTATAAYFILEGQAAAGVPDGDSYRGLSTMREGDFFGEIAALTGSPRTADVVADKPTTLLEVPAEALRATMVVPEINKLVLNTLTERLVRTNLADLPRLAANDQSALRDLRTPGPRVEALPRSYSEA